MAIISSELINLIKNCQNSSQMINSDAFSFFAANYHINRIEFQIYHNSIPKEPVILYDNSLESSHEPISIIKNYSTSELFLRAYIDDHAPELNDEETSALMSVLDMISMYLCWNYASESAKFYMTHDLLTLAPNQYFFYKALGKIIDKGKCEQYTAIFFNICNCRYINTIFGGSATNAIFKDLSSHFMSMISYDDLECFARLGGDYFAIVIMNDKYDDIISLLNGFPVEIDYESDHISYTLTFRAGVARLDNSYDDFHKIMDAISSAYYMTRIPNNPKIITYNDSINTSLYESHEIVNSIKESIENNKLLVYFQPYYNLKDDSKKIIGAEALVRLKHEDEVYTGSDLIPLAENNMIVPLIDFYVLNNVCERLEKWTNEGYPIVPISCNFSAQTIKIPNATERIISIIDKHNINREDICIEIRESAFNDSYELIEHSLRKLSEQNVRVGLDNSNDIFIDTLTIYKHNFDYVKINYNEINTSNIKEMIFLNNLIKLCMDINLKIIVEHVHDENIIRELIKNGCNIFQSTYFDKALSERFFLQKLKQLNESL